MLYAFKKCIQEITFLFIILADSWHSKKGSEAEENQYQVEECVEKKIPSKEIIQIINYPHMLEQFSDPDSGLDSLILIANYPSGATGFRVVLDEDGLAFFVHFNWSETLHETDDFFSKILEQKKLDKTHPMILAIKKGLVKHRSNIFQAPEGSFKFVLPFKVQTSAHSWYYHGVTRNNGTLAVMACFVAQNTAYESKLDGAVSFTA